MPYDKEFVNPLEKSALKVTILNTSYNELEHLLQTNCPIIYTRETTEKLIERKYENIDGQFRLRIFLYGQSLLSGILLFSAAFVIMLVSKSFTLISMFMQLISICLVHYSVSRLALFSKFENEVLAAPAYIKYKRGLQLLRNVQILLFLTAGIKLLQPVEMYIVFGFFGIAFLFTNYFITTHFKQEWWGQVGLPSFRTFYNTN